MKKEEEDLKRREDEELLPKRGELLKTDEKEQFEMPKETEEKKLIEMPKESLEEKKLTDERVKVRDWEGQDNMQQFINEPLRQEVKKEEAPESSSLEEKSKDESSL